MTIDSVGSRVQGLAVNEQVLVLARMVEERTESGVFPPSAVETLFDEIGLPRPTKISNVFGALQHTGRLTRMKNVRGAWKMTPVGRAAAQDLVTDMDLAALFAETARPKATLLGATAHPVIPPSLAPPGLIGPLQEFLAEFPFERNVFGMTRFPGASEDGNFDPIAPALERAANVCEKHGLVFHLASDRNIVDDLWANVAAHMWGCRFGIAFFEARSKRGLNYNLNIEVGSCLVLGRRLALLKDRSLEAMPTDLVGHIYLSVDLDEPESVAAVLDDWVVGSLKA
ncbi:MAG: hypothetical protein JST59_30020 [Actinobacteria bacterium]|nr:hypothetical protein [Actinomycetota bacterium]